MSFDWRFLKVLPLVALLVCSAHGQEAVPVFEVSQIAKIKAAEGKAVKVRGLVETTGKSKGSGMNYLNFEGGEFTAVVFAKNLKRFPDGEPADVLAGKWVEISGDVKFYNKKPQIIVDGPEQIVLLDPETKKPPVAAPKPEAKPEEKEAVPGPKAEVKEAEPKKDKVDPRLYFDDP